MRVIKNILRWIGVLFFLAGGYVCVDNYNAPIVGIFWFWTAIVVSPLPIRLRDSFGLQISDKTIDNVMWIMVGAAVVAVFMVI